jgi:alkanesulfonate monooxygenase SsuD/methylene tetrahydromethanopterin reductase-like flavin-dependent oxidoreductase (luciferase family)
VDGLADSTGPPRLTFDLMADYIGVLRRLWRGETINHDGFAGRFRNLTLGVHLDVPPPVVVAAMGDRTAQWAGRHADGVLLNSLWSASAVARTAALIRRGAEEAGRNPDDVRIWAVLVTACEVPEATYLSTIVRRMNTYLYIPGMFESLCAVNGWDAAQLPILRQRLADLDGPTGAGLLGDEMTTRSVDALREMAEMYPEHWITEGNAVGSAAQCLAAVRDRRSAGATGIVFHGTRPHDLAPLLTAWHSETTRI